MRTNTLSVRCGGMGQNRYININVQNKVFTFSSKMLSVLLVGLSMLSSAAYAQQNFPASTRVLTPLTVTNQSDMNFGRITPGTTQSLIRIRRGINTAVVRSGDARLAGGTVQRAEFTITADPLTSVQISLPRNINLQNSAGDTMRINTFRLNNGGGRISSRTIDSSGNLSVFVSALLRVEPSQAAGVYNGSYEVTVEYN